MAKINTVPSLKGADLTLKKHTNRSVTVKIRAEELVNSGGGYQWSQLFKNKVWGRDLSLFCSSSSGFEFRGGNFSPSLDQVLIESVYKRVYLK